MPTIMMVFWDPNAAMNCVSSGKWNWANDHSELKYFGKTPWEVSDKTEMLDVKLKKYEKTMPTPKCYRKLPKQSSETWVLMSKMFNTELSCYIPDGPKGSQGTSQVQAKNIRALDFLRLIKFGPGMDMMNFGSDQPSTDWDFIMLNISSLYP